MFKNDWIKPLAFALALPSTIAGSVALSFTLVKKGILKESLAWPLALSVIVSTLILMVVYAFKRKNKI